MDRVSASATAVGLQWSGPTYSLHPPKYLAFISGLFMEVRLLVQAACILVEVCRMPRWPMMPPHRSVNVGMLKSAPECPSGRRATPWRCCCKAWSGNRYRQFVAMALVPLKANAEGALCGVVAGYGRAQERHGDSGLHQGRG